MKMSRQKGSEAKKYYRLKGKIGCHHLVSTFPRSGGQSDCNKSTGKVISKPRGHEFLHAPFCYDVAVIRDCLNHTALLYLRKQFFVGIEIFVCPDRSYINKAIAAINYPLKEQ